ncbi:tetratricopeptide repeat-containing sensor histidine kinase [Balneolales bacterium ANBcel1]|nr:tetratricopeptide repeat-containing sensor histidine kinase [Balneolales bacterium ANBcel1]
MINFWGVRCWVVSMVVLPVILSSCQYDPPKDREAADELSALNESLDVLVLESRYEEADSLYVQIIETAKSRNNYSALITAYTHYSRALMDRGRYDEALTTTEKALEYVEEYATPEQAVMVKVRKTFALDRLNRRPEALETIEQGMALIPDVDDPVTVARVYATRGGLVSEINPAEALEFSYEALEIFRRERATTNEATIRNNIGRILHRQGDHEKALEEFERALELNHDAGDKVNMAIIYNNQANTLKLLERYEEAVLALMNALEINEELEVTSRVAQNNYNLGNVYLETGELDLAYSFFRQGYEMSREIGFPPGIMYLSMGLAEALMETQRHGEVLTRIREARAIAGRIDNMDMTAKSWEMEARLMETEGAYSEAVEAYKMVMAYSDSLNQRRRDQEFEEVRAAYEVDLAEAENEILRQELDYRERLSTVQQTLLVVLVVTGLIFAGLLIVMYRNHRKLENTYHNLELKSDEIISKNKQLEELNSDLKQLNIDKDRLIDIIVHDLRNPLFGVIGFLDVVAESVHDKEEQKYLEMARKSAYRLNHLIDSLLDVHSLEKQAEDLEMKSTRVDEMVSGMVESYRDNARSKEIQLSVDAEPMEVQTYEPYVSRILDNLFSNAIKFSPAGAKVTVKVGMKNRDWWELKVSDTGPGFSEEDRQKLYQMFARLSAQPTGGEASTGLGLYAVHMLVERLGGTIELQTKQGEGSTFTCRFPIS